MWSRYFVYINLVWKCIVQFSLVYANALKNYEWIVVNNKHLYKFIQNGMLFTSTWRHRKEERKKLFRTSSRSFLLSRSNVSNKTKPQKKANNKQKYRKFNSNVNAKIYMWPLFLCLLQHFRWNGTALVKQKEIMMKKCMHTFIKATILNYTCIEESSWRFFLFSTHNKTETKTDKFMFMSFLYTIFTMACIINTS